MLVFFFISFEQLQSMDLVSKSNFNRFIELFIFQSIHAASEYKYHMEIVFEMD